MKFSENWLREWISDTIPDGFQVAGKAPAQVSSGAYMTYVSSEASGQHSQNLKDDGCTSVANWPELLTEVGLEVEGLTALNANLQHVCVGQVLHTERHPNANRLSICQVNIGNREMLTIVCGASNVRTGLHVVVAKVGAILPGDFTIKATKIRGIASQGMLCSSKELGLGELNDGIMELPADAPVGKDFSNYFGLPDRILNINLTPNRGDCLSVLGLMRELSAITQKPLLPADNITSFPELTAVCQMPGVLQSETAAPSNSLPVQVTAPNACPRYLGRIVRNISLDAITPLWMKERLRRSGMRSIHPVVDVMNYVMLELGQPLHAFDLHTLTGGIEVRQSRAGETVTLLDVRTIDLPQSALVIADQKQILALAGIMGGLSSAVTTGTQSIFIESAFFSPHAIRPTLRALNLQSDAAHRFERGVDPALTQRALQRATALVLEICGGQAGEVIEVSSPNNLPPIHTIKLRRTRITRILGITLDDNTVVNLLERLNFRIETLAEGWQVTVPSYRFDISIEVDLIEEIARLYGYTAIPSRQLQAPLVMQPASEHQLTTKRIRHFFVDRGYQEAINYSFIDAQHAALFQPTVTPLALKNPIAEQMAVMRTSLWPGLLQAAISNYNRQQTHIRLFEVGVCFLTESTQLQQMPKLAGLLMGERTAENWHAPLRPVDFFDLKGDIENLLQFTGKTDWQFNAASHPALHPGRCAVVQKGEHILGYLGELHPELHQYFDLPTTAYLFELALPELMNRQLPNYHAPSKYPSIRRDFSWVLPEQTPYQRIADCVKLLAGDALQNLHLFDLYQGQNIEAGTKSIALALTFQLPTRTLTDIEIDQLVEKIINGLQKILGAKLRE